MRSPSLLASFLIAIFSLPGAQSGASSTPDALRAEIQALEPAKLVWREIDWRYCLLEGIRDSREQKKPILLWAFINADPSEERC
jgi:hypothetical protein